MIEINCRKCGNMTETGNACKLYGSDPKKAAAACRADLFMNYHQKATAPVPAPGTIVWVVTRDEDANAEDVTGFLFLAYVEGAAIVTPRIYGRDTLAGIMRYHIEETQINDETQLRAFPVEDCYETRAEAQAALEKEG